MKKMMMALLLLVAAACAGTQARENVMIPTMEVAWAGIAEDVRASGVDAEVEIAAMEAALAGRDIAALSVVNWPWLRSLAIAGAQTRSPGVAQSLIERINLFDEAYQKVIHGRI